jgi:hypothetical protein
MLVPLLVLVANVVAFPYPPEFAEKYRKNQASLQKTKGDLKINLRSKANL